MNHSPFQILFIIPDSRERPYLDLLILGACDELLFVLKPLYLSNGASSVSLKHEDWVTIFRRPDSHYAILASCDDLLV